VIASLPTTAPSPTPPIVRHIEVYRDARADYRWCGSLELRDLAEALAFAAADPFDDVDLLLSRERLRAAVDELRRRERLGAADPALPDPREAAHAERLRLARDIRERVDILDVLHAALGYPVDPANRAGTEWAGPCPSCGGTDRFRVWPGPPGRFWCRQCTWSGDAITLVRNLVPGCAAFGDAVDRLAEATGVGRG
jgi:hypothetical protein